MAAAIPLGAFAVAGGGAAMLGANTALAMNIGMIAMTGAQLYMNSRKQVKKSQVEFAVQEFTPRSDTNPLPRTYGTTRVPVQLVWFGNYYKKKTKKNASTSKTY